VCGGFPDHAWRLIDIADLIDDLDSPAPATHEYTLTCQRCGATLTTASADLDAAIARLIAEAASARRARAADDSQS
jgi:hypothetical protein